MKDADKRENATKNRLIDTIPDMEKYESPNIKADMNFSKILLEPRQLMELQNYAEINWKCKPAL